MLGLSGKVVRRDAHSRWPLRGYVALVVAAGVGALALAAQRLPLDHWHEIVFFFVLCALAQRMPVPLFRNSSMSVAFAIGFAALVYLGPATAVWVQLGAGLMMAVVPHRKPFIKMAFNAGAIPLQQAFTGWTYAAIGGAVAPERLDWMLFPPAIVAITVFVFANTLALSLAIALETGSSLRNIFNMNYRWLLPNYVGVGLAGLGMGVAVQVVGLPGVTVFFIPLAMAWYSYKLYMAKTEEVRRRNEELQLTNAQLDVANVRLNQRVTELAALNKIGLSLNGSLDLSNILGEIVDSALKLVPGQAAAIALADPTSGRLAIATSMGLPPGTAGAFSAYDGAIVRALETDAVVVIGDTAAAGESALASAGIGALFCMPLHFGGQVGGAFFMTFAGAREIGEDERQLLSTLAQQASTAVHNARLYQEIEQGYLNTIQAMVSVVDARERYAQGHSERVRAYAAACARQLELNDRQTATLELAALFHDIGHIGIPETVLNKPGELSGEEWEMVRKHPLLGVTILKQVPRMDAVVPVILQHHERYDGLGYPEGLLGNETHVLAQILAVADAYEAMTSRRPHRPALTPEQAAVELRKGAGSQFAPQVVEAFIKAAAAPIKATASTEVAFLRLLQSDRG